MNKLIPGARAVTMQAVSAGVGSSERREKPPRGSDADHQGLTQTENLCLIIGLSFITRVIKKKTQRAIGEGGSSMLALRCLHVCREHDQTRGPVWTASA